MACNPCEPTLSEALSDPVILAVMKADRVDPAALATDLRHMAARIGQSKTARRSEKI